MIDPKQYPLCEVLVKEICSTFSSNGWITLCDERVFSCLANDSVAAKCMKNTAWDIDFHVGPLINEHDGTLISYSRYMNEKFEPIVIYFEQEGRWGKEVFLTEEFVMFYKLHKELKSKNEYIYYQVDPSGDDVEVARVSEGKVVVKKKYIQEYISVKKLNLLVYTDEIKYSIKSISEFECGPVSGKITEDNNCIFSYSLSESPDYGCGYKSYALLRGKSILRHNEKHINHLWKLHDPGYEDFIIGADDDGNEVLLTCEECRIPNAFTRQGDEPYSLSPVFFKREVLSKYIQQSNKYTISDGYLYGPSWGMHIDNDRLDDYIVVLLVDLGRIPHKEQLHWKQFNVLPSPNCSFSMTTWRRWILGIPTDCSEAPDLIFKRLYQEVNIKWERKYGWLLFKKLAKNDLYHLEALHIMTNDDNQEEFDGLILSITKLLIESLNEKELVKAIDCNRPEIVRFLKEKKVEDCKASNIRGGITKLECFLISKGLLQEEHIKYLRQIQDLRSCTVAHRRHTKLDAKTKELLNSFGLLQESDKIVFFNIMKRINLILEWLLSITE